MKSGKITSTISDLFSSSKTDKTPQDKPIDQESIELLKQKIRADIVEVNIRLIVSAQDKARAQQIMTELQATLNQFDQPHEISTLLPIYL